MAKRKRVTIANGGDPVSGDVAKKRKAVQPQQASSEPATETTIQIIAGSYDRVLHGLTATIRAPSPGGGSAKEAAKAAPPPVTFADTFLFNAHTSAIRCLALSPPSAPDAAAAGGGRGAQKVMLASGSTDERINVYNLSAHPPSARSRDAQRALSSLAPRPIAENAGNRELGTLLHHGSAVTAIVFPTRSKLLSSSEDSTIAVTRTRDWNLLSTIRCPVPKAQGRPSGDTAAHGATPSGVNDFAVHPSMKLMISVGRGERSMRLWNLVTGKRAGVLNFGRDVLAEIGEARLGAGEGRKVEWGSADGADEFAVAFDRDVLVFGMDSVPKCRLMKGEKTKIHKIAYLKVDADGQSTVLAVSTEDGRILFFSTRAEDLEKPDTTGGKPSLPNARLVAQLGGQAAGVSGRVKDFQILQTGGADAERGWYVITASSDGKVRVWTMSASELQPGNKDAGSGPIGKLLGTYSTENRITCVEAFVMIPRPDGAEESDEEPQDPDEDPSDNSDDD